MNLVIGTGIAGLGAGFAFQKVAATTRFQLLGDLVTQVKTTEKAIALTYDDGPNPPYTNGLLEILERFQAKATFFTVGQQLEQHLELARTIHTLGHELGNHSYSHRRLIWTSRQAIATEIQATDQLLRQVGVQTPIHFRAPFGYKRIRLPYVLEQLHKKNILWNIDPRDYQANHCDAIVNHVLERVRPGAIVLLHDGGGDRHLTLEATARLLPLLKARGYHFKTISQLLALQSSSLSAA